MGASFCYKFQFIQRDRSREISAARARFPQLNCFLSCCFKCLPKSLSYDFILKLNCFWFESPYILYLTWFFWMMGCCWLFNLVANSDIFSKIDWSLINLSWLSLISFSTFRIFFWFSNVASSLRSSSAFVMKRLSIWFFRSSSKLEEEIRGILVAFGCSLFRSRNSLSFSFYF